MPSCQLSSQKSPHTHPVPPYQPLGSEGEACPHCSEVTGGEEEEEGADRSQGWEGQGWGKSLNPRAATGLWNPQH